MQANWNVTEIQICSLLQISGREMFEFNPDMVQADEGEEGEDALAEFRRKDVSSSLTSFSVTPLLKAVVPWFDNFSVKKMLCKSI